MVKRESGWYRVKFNIHCNYEIALYYDEIDSFERSGFNGEYPSCDMFEINERMVMTQEGDLVYHNSEHDPVYNTQQEG